MWCARKHALRLARIPVRRFLDIGTGPGFLLDSLAADAKLEPPAAVQSQDEAAALLQAVAQLPTEQRAAFLLQAEGDLSVEEIAAITESNFETVKSRLRYARAKLRQLLWEYA